MKLITRATTMIAAARAASQATLARARSRSEPTAHALRPMDSIAPDPATAGLAAIRGGHRPGDG